LTSTYELRGHAYDPNIRLGTWRSSQVTANVGAIENHSAVEEQLLDWVKLSRGFVSWGY
jgi:hypothetical protein